MELIPLKTALIYGLLVILGGLGASYFLSSLSDYEDNSDDGGDD